MTDSIRQAMAENGAITKELYGMVDKLEQQLELVLMPMEKGTLKAGAEDNPPMPMLALELRDQGQHLKEIMCRLNGLIMRLK